jgi:homoserine/homoserine lactone efflux protein
MDLTTWVLFALTEAALCFTPGPAVIYVFSQGFARGMRPALAANAGVITGNIIYFTLSALGLGALILASHNLFLAIKWAGICYLLWLGWGMLSSSTSQLAAQQVERASYGKIYRGGLMLQLANPKNLVAFLVIFPPFIDPGGNIPLQFLILGITSVIIEIPALALFGAMGGGAHRRLRASRAVMWVERSAGAVLMALGASLAFVRRTD